MIVSKFTKLCNHFHNPGFKHFTIIPIRPHAHLPLISSPRPARQLLTTFCAMIILTQVSLCSRARQLLPRRVELQRPWACVFQFSAFALSCLLWLSQFTLLPVVCRLFFLKMKPCGVFFKIN